MYIMQERQVKEIVSSATAQQTPSKFVTCHNNGMIPWSEFYLHLVSTLLFAVHAVL